MRQAALAQLVEHIIRNDGVRGSNPLSGTIYPFKTESYKELRFAQKDMISPGYLGATKNGLMLLLE